MKNIYSSIPNLLLGALILAASPSVGLAGQVSQTQNFSGANTFSDSLSFNPFNPALGTLTGVTMTLDTTESVAVGVVNLSGASQTFDNASSSVPIEVTGLDALTTEVTGSYGPISGTAGTFPPVDYFYDSAQLLSSDVSALAADLSLYESGAFDLTVGSEAGTYSGSQTSGTPGTVYFGGAEIADGTVTLTYDYASAPDSSLPIWLTAGVIAGLFLAARKFRAPQA